MKKSRLVLLLVTAVLVASAGIAQAALITNVVRANGQSGNRAPVGAFTGDTAPLATQAGGLIDKNLVFSDRDVHAWNATPAQIMGSEYVRTFNTDKAYNATDPTKNEADVTYTVTLGQTAWLWLTIDDRIWTAFPTPQAAADQITKAFAAPGRFKDSGVDVFVNEGGTVTMRLMNVFQAQFAAGTYVFGANNSNNNFYTIGAMENPVPEPMTLSLLALGGLLAARKRS
jgi:hypothetical protein